MHTVTGPLRYAIGDVQGCLVQLQQLIGHIAQRSPDYRLWFVGDLVNRGPDSLQTLRYVRALGERATVVLGNHDFYLLALAAGMAPKNDPGENVHEVLAAPDADELIDWLRRRPFMHVEDQFAMVHAGLLPQWSIAQAQALAAEVEEALRGPHWRRFLLDLWGNQPDRWSAELAGMERARLVVNVLARMRCMRRDGRVDTRYKGTPEDAPDELIPWYAAPDAAWRSHRVICGHWSALGLRKMEQVVALDSGCVWGGSLTAYCLEDEHVLQVACPNFAGEPEC